MKLFKTSILTILLAISTFVFSYLVFGFYFERYEPLSVSLLSGVFTPGMPYSDFFYLAHIFIVKLFAVLFTNFPETPWLSIFQYTYIFISHYILLMLLNKYTKSNLVLMVSSVVLSLFIMEFYVHHVMTRVSFLLSFAALLKIIDIYHTKEKNLLKSSFCYVLFILAVLIRPEPPTIIITIVSLTYFIFIYSQNFIRKIIKTFVVFWKVGVICLLAIFWVSAQIYNSDDFYKQIEPEVEYELAARNNFIPIKSMTNKVDSMRYMAIYNGVWGDATTNDADFLRSLIASEKKSDQFMFLVNNAKSNVLASISNCKSIFILNTALFFILLLTTILKRRDLFIKTILAHLAFFSIVFLMSYKIKMVETSLSPMLFSMAVIYLFISLKLMSNDIIKSLWLGILISTSIYHLFFLNNSIKPAQNKFEKAQKVNSLIAKQFSRKSLFIDQIAFELMFKGFKPFETIKFDGIDKIYLFNSQHMTTVEPYKTYLAKDCNCDPNNYRAYFNFLLNKKEDVVFFISEESSDFFEEYLSIVHKLDTKWSPVEKTALINFKDLYKGLNFYTIDRKKSELE